jgi:hypothetical protein
LDPGITTTAALQTGTRGESNKAMNGRGRCTAMGIVQAPRRVKEKVQG